MNVKVRVKEIDLRSLLIGFLLAAVVFLMLGAGSGTQDVRIVGISTYDNLRVQVEKISSSDQLPVKIMGISTSDNLRVHVEKISYSDKFPVKIMGIDWGVEIPVKIEDQPIDVRMK